MLFVLLCYIPAEGDMTLYRIVPQDGQVNILCAYRRGEKEELTMFLSSSWGKENPTKPRDGCATNAVGQCKIESACKNSPTEYSIYNCDRRNTFDVLVMNIIQPDSVDFVTIWTCRVKDKPAVESLNLTKPG